MFLFFDNILIEYGMDRVVGVARILMDVIFDGLAKVFG